MESRRFVCDVSKVWRTVLVLAFALAACAPVRPPLVVRATGQGESCKLSVNNVEMSADALDRAKLHALAQRYGRRMIVDTDANTPYRCVGGVVIDLQSAGFRVVQLSVNGVPAPIQ